MEAERDLVVSSHDSYRDSKRSDSLIDSVSLDNAPEVEIVDETSSTSSEGVGAQKIADEKVENDFEHLVDNVLQNSLISDKPFKRSTLSS